MQSANTLDFMASVGPATRAILDEVLLIWPEHEKFLRKSFAERSPELIDTTEAIASLLGKVAAHRGRSLAACARDYRNFVEQLIYPEEIFFHREGRYRLSTFAEANAQVYDNSAVMTLYMDGLFVSDALWVNHASAMNDFAKIYLPTARAGGAHLEIGPGHGMLLHLAIRFGSFANLSAWDLSPTSIGLTQEVLSLLGQSGKVTLELRDMYSPEVLSAHAGRFDTIVFSEVLEHLERPREAIDIIRELLAPGGSVWINVPANGPSPDHLYLLRSPQEVIELVESAGLEVSRWAAYPVAGASVERAVRQGLPMSCIAVGTKPA